MYDYTVDLNMITVVGVSFNACTTDINTPVEDFSLTQTDHRNARIIIICCDAACFLPYICHIYRNIRAIFLFS